jgi:GNAT superfamily N-acetyltransferase
MDDYVIRLLSGEDLEGALRLSSTAGWNQRIEDWRMLVSLAPTASFAAFAEERVVGTAIGIDYGRFSWIAMMLVDPAWRGRGMGRRLLETAIDAVPSDRPIRLDATPMGRPLYQAYGFEEEALLTRQVSESDERAVTPGPIHAQHAVWPMTPARLGEVLEEDLQVFGGRRRAVLEWSLDTAPQYGQFLETDRRHPQYCLGRRGRFFDQIGPVIAADDHAACALVGAALVAAAGRSIAVDSFDERGHFQAWLRACGFRAERPLFRMRRPPAAGTRTVDEPACTPLAEFAIFGPEFA